MKDGNSTRCCESRSAICRSNTPFYKPLFRLAEWEGKPEGISQKTCLKKIK